jgi:hypothetical protein
MTKIMGLKQREESIIITTSNPLMPKTMDLSLTKDLNRRNIETVNQMKMVNQLEELNKK